MMMGAGIVLGNFLSATRIQTDPTKVKVILHFPIPKTPKHVHSFIDCSSYYRLFIENFANIAHPLFQFLTKDVYFLWTSDCNVAFVKIKELVCRALILRGLDRKLQFHIHSDASQAIVGVVLG